MIFVFVKQVSFQKNNSDLLGNYLNLQLFLYTSLWIY
jgi:hypothetical protein